MRTPLILRSQADTARFCARRDDSLRGNPASMPKETGLFRPLRRDQIRSVEQMEKNHFQVVQSSPVATVALS
jgi:hypothetical protein